MNDFTLPVMMCVPESFLLLVCLLFLDGTK